MWPVKNGLATPEWTLFLNISSHSVSCAVRRDSPAYWIPGSVQEVLMDMPLDSLKREQETPPLFFQLVFNALDEVKNRLATLRLPVSVGHVRVLISEKWLALASLPWSESLKNNLSAQAMARTHLLAGGFTLSSDDVVCIDEAPFGAPRLVVAYPAVLLAGVQQFVGHWGAQLSSVLPSSVAAWKVLSRSHKICALAVIDKEVLLIARGDGSPRMSSVTLRSMDGEVGAGLPALWSRLSVREPRLEQIKTVHVLQLDGVDRQLSWPQPQFEPVKLTKLVHTTLPIGVNLCLQCNDGHQSLDALKGTRNLGVAAIGLAMLTLVLTLILLLHAWDTNTKLHQALSQLDAKQKVVRPIAVPVALSKEDRMRIPAVNAAIRQLNLPMAELLRALTTTQDINVSILSIQTMNLGTAREENSKIQIMAEAKTSLDMTRYVAHVGSNPIFSGAYLTHHEIMETLPGQPLRFSMEAQWTP